MIKSYAPGRAELLGNHTDYNEGLVLAIAVERGILLSGSLRANSEILIYARDLAETYEGTLEKLQPSTEKPWANYLLGVFEEFRRRDLPLGGVNLTIQSDLPLGAGLSSSAALEIATALFLQKAFNPREWAAASHDSRRSLYSPATRECLTPELAMTKRTPDEMGIFFTSKLRQSMKVTCPALPKMEEIWSSRPHFTPA